MGQFKATWLWSLATVALLAGIPQSSCGSSSKNAIKLVKPTGKPDSMVSRRQHPAPLSVEDDENYSGNRPNFGSFPQGFSQGPPSYGRYADEPSDRYDVEDAPADNNGMGFMPEFGPPKGFPDLSKLTGGEFPKMDTAAQDSGAGQIENVPQYSTYPGGDSPKSYRPFPQYSTQGGPGPNYDDSEDGPSSSPAFGNYGSPNNPPPQSAPRRKPFRNSRPSFGGGRPQGFGGPGGPGPYGGSDGPSSFGAPEGLIGGGPGPYRGSSALEGSSRPFGGSGRPSRPSSPFGNSPDGPSYRPGPFGPDGPSSRPGFGSDGPPSRPGFGSDGPPSRPGFGSDGPSSSRSPFGGSTSDTPYGIFGSDGPPSRPGFGSDGPSSRPGFGSDGPQSRPGFGSGGPPSRPSFGLDGPPSRSPFGGSSSDGPSYRPGGLFGSDGPSSRPQSFGPGGPPSRSPFISNSDVPDSSDGPSSYRPSSFGPDGPSSRPPSFGPDGPSSRPSSFGPDGPSSRPSSFGPDGPSSRPNPFGSDGPSSRPSSFGPDGPPSRPSPFGSDGPPSRSPFGGGPDGPSSSPGAFSFQNAGSGPGPNPGYRLSRGYPRHHPNTVQNDDFKESADGDFSPFNGPPQFSYPPRQHADYSRHEEYPRGPHPQEGPRSRRPEYLPHHSHGGPFGPTHRHDNLKRPVVLKVSGLKSKYIRELPPGPPIYYAPSPDMKTKDTSRKFQVPY